MNEKQTKTSLRPTKKQREVLEFIGAFIASHGYSPSYREIMAGLHYTSLATVALHVGSLIKRGQLRKRDRSARSLEIVPISVELSEPQPQDWLAEHIQQWLTVAQLHGDPADDLAIIRAALRILELPDVAKRLPTIAKHV